jgi:hypothetical protein
MGLDVWFKDDVRNMLLGIDLATAHLALRYNNTDEARAYQDGFAAALAAVATSFGIRAREITIRTIAADSGDAALEQISG